MIVPLLAIGGAGADRPHLREYVHAHGAWLQPRQHDRLATPAN
jgi:hypothetical protein